MMERRSVGRSASTLHDHSHHEETVENEGNSGKMANRRNHKTSTRQISIEFSMIGDYCG